MEPALRVLVPCPQPIPVPPPAPRAWDHRPAVVLADAVQPLRTSVASWAGEITGTVVVLGHQATVRAQATLLGGIGHSLAAGGPLTLVHAGAGGAGLLHTLAREHPGLGCLSIEVADTPAAHQTARAFAARPPPGSTEIVVDAAGRASVARWRQQPWLTTPPRLEAGDSVVVTGGTGGLGSAVARHLALRFGVHPVLVDAAPASSGRTRSALATLRQAGVAFTHATADVTDAGAVGAALAPTMAAGPVAAVVHCAGVIAAGPVAALDVPALTRLVRPKVEGLRTLLSVLDPRRLRVVLGFGSVLSHLPHPLVGAYAYANEQLRRDLQAAERVAPGPRYLAVEWSVWDGAGMAYASGAVAQARRAGYVPIPLAQGLEAVERLLGWAGPGSSVLVGASFPGLRARGSDCGPGRGPLVAGR